MTASATILEAEGTVSDRNSGQAVTSEDAVKCSQMRSGFDGVRWASKGGNCSSHESCYWRWDASTFWAKHGGWARLVNWADRLAASAAATCRGPPAKPRHQRILLAQRGRDGGIFAAGCLPCPLSLSRSGGGARERKIGAYLSSLARHLRPCGRCAVDQ